MINKAYVKEVCGNQAVLSVKRECMCAGNHNCNAKCFTMQNDIIEVTVDNNIGAKAGDYVEVEGKTSAILMYAAVVFILPVFMGFVLYFTTTSYIIAGTGFVLTVIIAYFLLNNKIKNRNDFEITKILQEKIL